MILDPHTEDLAEQVLAAARAAGLTVAGVESCTGGLVMGALTAVPGSSRVVDRGFVTYSNAAKHELIDVPMPMIVQFGAVSEPVAIAMAEGALQHSRAHLAVAVTGVAGPGGGTCEKPVGLVHLACAARGLDTIQQRHIFAGRGRSFIRWQTVAQAFRMLSQQAVRSRNP